MTKDICSVFDSDGEFLLIEAADHLPHWVTPTNSENRVRFNPNHLHWLLPTDHLLCLGLDTPLASASRSSVLLVTAIYQAQTPTATNRR